MQQRETRRIAQQVELFETPSEQPSWDDLPDETRTTVTQLFARMLRQQRRQGATCPVREVEHE